MKLRQIAALPFVKAAHLGSESGELARVTCNSRQVGAETAFFALQGRNTDGHRFVQAALLAGAPAVFVSDPQAFAAQKQAMQRANSGILDRSSSLFLVSPGRAPLADLVQTLYGAPSKRLNLYGVTGTNGKATVTFLVAQMLRSMNIPCGILGGLGLHLPGRVLSSERTTPEAPDIAEFLALCLAEGVDHVAMEVSSIGIHEERTRGLRFRGAGYTNLTQDHLDYHGTMEAYRNVKERLFLDYDIGSAVLNGQDPASAGLAAKLQQQRPAVPVLTYSLEGQADLTVDQLQLNATGTRGALRYRDHHAHFMVPLPGRFNVSNWLTAVGLLLHAGLDLGKIAASGSACYGAPGRLERIQTGVPMTVLVDYAHTPDALETVLRTVRPLTQGRLIVVFGCGGDRDRDKRPKMGAIAERLADVVFLTTDNPRSEQPETILSEIRRGMHGSTPPRLIVDRTEAIHAALVAARPGDLVLLAGKGAETYQEAQGQKFPYDDREIVRAWDRARG